MTNNPIFLFLAELITRLKGRSPKFFRILQAIAFITTLIPGIPGVLDFLGVNLSPFLVGLENKTLAIAALVATFLTGLPVDKDHLELHAQEKLRTGESDKSVQAQVEAKLPFTEKVDK